MMKTKVLVAMSGGVDSSVAAALLKENGYDVTGVTLQIWPEVNKRDNNKSESGCCSLAAVNDARRVADILGIPYYVLNFKEIFEKKVIGNFISEYNNGRTPNPCIVCNNEIKFGALLDKAATFGMDYIATGHYASISFDTELRRFLLKKSSDPTKDQTYALYKLTQEQLSRTLFPLGELKKERVRELASKMGFAVAQKPDSQEICFVPDNDYAGFIAEHSKNFSAPGFFKDTSGNVLGKHKGLIYYTIGQRKGLGISSDRPLFVIAIDKTSNSVILGDEKAVFSHESLLSETNYIPFQELKEPMKVNAKIRYSAKEAEAMIYPVSSYKARVTFSEPQRAITPGQSMVFYNNDIVIGGGVIQKLTE